MSHIAFAHSLWTQLLSPGDNVIDATCGNGHDTLFLLDQGCHVTGCDVQPSAIDETQRRTEGRALLVCGCHAELAASLEPESIQLAVFNLGYLPGAGNKELTTQTETTLLALERFLPTIRPGGAISVTLYPGHPEGAREAEAVLDWAAQLPQPWSASHHRWLRSATAPSLLFVKKSQTAPADR